MLKDELPPYVTVVCQVWSKLRDLKVIEIRLKCFRARNREPIISLEEKIIKKIGIVVHSFYKEKQLWG